MAIDTTPAPVTAPGASAGASPLSVVTPVTPTALMNALAAGATLEARLVATLADGTARLATRLGAVAVKMVDGSEVPPIGGRMTLRVEADSAADGQPLLIARPALQAGAPPAGAMPTARGPQETMGQAVANALARQDGLGASLAAVETLVTSTRPPLEVAAAAARLLNTRLPLDKAPSAKALLAAMRASGIFLEADLARAAAPAGGDVKAALLALKAALAGLGDAGAAATAKAPTGQGVAAPSPVAAGVPQPAAAPAAPSPAATGAPGAGVSASPVAASLLPSATPEEPAPAVPPRPTLSASLTPPPVAGQPQPTPRALAAAGLLGLQEIADTTPPSRPEPAPVIGHAAPPLRGAWPEPEAAPRARTADPLGAIPADGGAAEPVARARAGTEAALARLVLDQVASLKDDGAVARATNPAERQQPQWTFEVPVLIDGRSGSLRFQVTRDGGERREGAAERRQASWRLRLAFAIEPLGPIRAQVGLVGGRVAVGIWAERPATVVALSAHSGELRDALVAADFDVDEIHLAEGLPPDAQRRAGRAMLDATA
jgi:hypothetical protein